MLRARQHGVSIQEAAWLKEELHRWCEQLESTYPELVAADFGL